VATGNEDHWAAKRQAAAEAEAAQDALRQDIAAMPANQDILTRLENAVKQANTVCNLLENQALELGKGANAAAAQNFIGTRYLPARAELDLRFDPVRRELAARYRKAQDE